MSHAHTVFSVVTAGLLLSAAFGWGQEGPPAVPNQLPAHLEASGVVIKVTATAITLKTRATTITLNANATHRSGLKDVKVGDQLTVWMNENNTVVDVHEAGHQRDHQIISGVIASNHAATELALSTPDGIRTFPLKQGDTRATNLDRGTRVTVEIDEMGRLMDIHKQ